MNDDYLMLIEKQVEKTSATNSIRGYYYQILVTIKWWLELHNTGEDYKIYCEVEDDLKIENKKEIKYVQVKSYKKNFTINDEVFQKTIGNFYRIYLINKSRTNKFFIEANNFVGDKDKLLKKWATYDMNEEEKNYLSKIFKNKIDDLFKHLIIEDDEFFNFFNMIQPKFKKEEVEQCLSKEKKRIFSMLDKEGIVHNKDIILAGLIQHVIEKSVDEDIRNRLLDNQCIKLILENRYDVQEKYIIMVNEIKEITDSVKNISSDVQEIKEGIKEIRQCFETKCYEDNNININGDSTLINIRSRKEGETSEYNLNLSEFFNLGDKSDAYKIIKKHSYWNEEIIKKIDRFFMDLDKNNMKRDKILIDLRYMHYCIAFYIAHTYDRAFGGIIPKKEGIVYYDTSHLKSYDSWNIDKIKLGKGEDTVVIINPSIERKDEVFTKVRNYVENEELKVDELIDFTLLNNNSNSINENNIYSLADEVNNALSDYKGTIHLFLTGPMELAFIIGKKMGKKSDIIIYETLKYKCEEVNGKVYTDAIKIM